MILSPCLLRAPFSDCLSYLEFLEVYLQKRQAPVPCTKTQLQNLEYVLTETDCTSLGLGQYIFRKHLFCVIVSLLP